MPFHRAIVKSGEAVRVSPEVYQRISERMRPMSLPIQETQGYQQLCKGRIHPRMEVWQDQFSMPLHRNCFGLYEVPVAIEGHPLRFIVDSGAQISGIRASVAQRLGLKPLAAQLEIGSIGATKQLLPALHCETMQLGGICWRDLPLIALDAQRFSIPLLHWDLLRFDGILGWDVLHQLDFELDTIEKRMRVLINRFRFDYPNLVPCSFPTVLVEQENGGTAVFGIDSGARQSWLGEAYIERQKLPIAFTTKAIGFGVHGREELDLVLVDRVSLRLDRAAITLHRCMSGFVQIFPAFAYDGVLGNEIFRGRRIRFVNSRNMVLLT